MQNAFRLLLILAFFAAASCGSDKADSPKPVVPPLDSTLTTDSALYELVKNNTFAYYLGKDTLWSPAANSPHGPFKLRFNAKALAALDASGRLPVGAKFPDSSIVVKEFYAGSQVDIYVPMMKLPRDTNSGSGWVWGEYLGDGGLIHSVTNKGQGCIHCHTQTPNRDFLRSFDLH